MSPESKFCTKCKRMRPIIDFEKSKAGYKGGRYTECRICRRTRSRMWAKKNPERRRYLSRRAILKGYGLTPEQYDILLESQNGVCAICRKPETRITQGKLCDLAVDHDKKTERVRGLLCVRCNLGIGALGDSSELVSTAAIYLKRHGA